MDDPSDLRRTLVKVPEITFLFWIVKVLTTGAGESASDWLSERFNPGVAAAVGVIGLIVALIIQFRKREYVPWAYWFAVVMVAVFGTMLADVLHGGLHVPYAVSTIVWLVVLAIVFRAWYSSEKTLSIHSIYTRRRETCYWTTVVVTFALGTAAGDWTATTLGWGYLDSGFAFGIAIAAVAVAYYVMQRGAPADPAHPRLGAVLNFWVAYILTRPLGASFADWFGKSRETSGLGYGDGTVTAWVLALIILLVAYLSVKHRSARSPAAWNQTPGQVDPPRP